MRILLITGLSGAGKSVALKTLEDIGYEAVDNAPLALIPSLLSGRQSQHLAVGADVRVRDFSSQHFQEAVTALRAAGAHEVQVLFFDCDNEVLQRRFTETRRKHPLAGDRPVMEGILEERALLLPVRDLADAVLDTSEWNSGDLRHALREYYGTERRALSIFVTSFSFKRGVPRDVDLVFDVRFLRNPHYDEQLRNFSGLDAPVATFIEADPDFRTFFARLIQLVEPLLPRYLQEGKSYLTFGIGCTGGRHRSVYVAEKLAGFLKQKEYKVAIRHRDLSAERKEKLG